MDIRWLCSSKGDEDGEGVEITIECVVKRFSQVDESVSISVLSQLLSEL